MSKKPELKQGGNPGVVARPYTIRRSRGLFEVADLMHKDKRLSEQWQMENSDKSGSFGQFLRK